MARASAEPGKVADAVDKMLAVVEASNERITKIGRKKK
jgi:hypothetical protein